jgi:hypothetical protein
MRRLRRREEEKGRQGEGEKGNSTHHVLRITHDV